MSFITIDKLNGSSGETISTITIPEYQGLEDRTQSFKVVVDGKEVFVNVQQKAFKPSLETNKQVVPFTQEVLTQSLQITSNFNWEARTDSSWFTLNQTEGNKGTTTIEISTSTIDSPSENRNGIINFYFGDTFVTAITVKQEFEVIFEVSMTSIDMTDETTATINVTSNVDWYCNTDITWINLDIVQGFGDKTITVTAQEFTGQDRNGTIDFYVYGELKKSVNIYQMFSDEQFYIEPYNEGETITIILDKYLINTSSTYIDSMEYFNDEVNDWVIYKISDSNGITINKKTYFKNYKRSRATDSGNELGPNSVILIIGESKIGGDIRTLLGNDNTNEYAAELFNGCKGLIDASNLILPFETLTYACYRGMFFNCTNLVSIPELPATTLAEYCYSNMFEKCTNLITGPILPATTLTKGCYSGMFVGCYNLNNITMLATDINAKDCLDYWLYDVSSTGTFTKKQGVEIPYGDSGIPNGWTVIELS